MKQITMEVELRSYQKNLSSPKSAIIYPLQSGDERDDTDSIPEEQRFFYEKRKWELYNNKQYYQSYENGQMKQYQVIWRWNIFCEFLFYHILYLILIGPLFLLFGIKFVKMPLMRNMKFFGNSQYFYYQTIIWIINCIVVLSYFFQNGFIKLSEIFYLQYALLIRCVVIACKYATFNTNNIILYKKEIVPIKIFNFDLMLQDWRFQTQKLVTQEIYKALFRQQQLIDIFKLKFIVQISCDTKIKIFSQELSQFNSNIILEKNEYCGFQILSYLIQEYQKKNSPKIQMIFSQLEALLLSVTTLLISLNQLQINLDLINHILIAIATFITFQGTNVFFHQAFYDFQRKFFILDQLMLIIKIIPENKLKLLPTIDFNDINSWRAWKILRQVTFDYGKTFTLRSLGFFSLCFLGFIVLFIFFQIYIMKLVILDLLEIMLLIEFLILYGAFSLRFLFLGAKLNSYFDEFNIALQDVKQVYLNLLEMEEVYENENPKHLIHKKFKQSNQNQNSSLAIRALIDEIENNIVQLKFDQRNNAFQVYGVIVTINLLKSTCMGMMTIISYSLQQRMKYKP